jgi:hypothetical protein
MNNIFIQHKEKRFKVGSQSLNSIETLIPWWPSKSAAKPEFAQLYAVVLIQTIEHVDAFF